MYYFTAQQEHWSETRKQPHVVSSHTAPYTDTSQKSLYGYRGAAAAPLEHEFLLGDTDFGSDLLKLDIDSIIKQ